MESRITAIYRTPETANLVRDELEHVGVARQRIAVLPQIARLGPADTSSATRADPDGAIGGLQDLHLPESDARTYEEALRNGDYVVSVSVDENTDLDRIQRIMRQPEGGYVLGEPSAGASSAGDAGGNRTVAAFFDTEAGAGAAVNRLREAGIPDRCIRVVPTPTERQRLQDQDGKSHADRHKKFWESLDDFSLPKEDRDLFAEAMARGAYLVAVHDFDAPMRDTVVAVLDTEVAVDLMSRASEWKAAGWTGYQGSEHYLEEERVIVRRDVGKGSVRVYSYVREVPVSRDVGR